jgi:ABC-type multidrug transport system fused ATPase/permease subunit
VTAFDHDRPVAAAPQGALGRLRRNARFIGSLIRVKPKPFSIAVAGAAVFALLTVASSFAIGWVIDNVVLPRFDDGDVAIGTVAAGVALIVGIGVVRAAAIVLRRSYAGITQWRVAQVFTDQVVGRYVRQPMSWHHRRADGDLVARGGVDAEASVGVLAPIPYAIGTVIMVVVSTVVMLVIDPIIGLLALIVFPILVGTNVVYERVVAEHFTRAQHYLGEFSAGVHESFEGVQLVKSYGAEERETERLAGLADQVRSSRVKAIRLRSWFEAVLDVIPSLTNIAIVVVGALRVRSGAMTVGELSAIIFLFTLLVFPLRLIGFALSELPRSIAAWTRIQEVVREPIEPDPVERIADVDDHVGIEMSKVSFTHQGDGPPTIHDVSFTLPRRHVTAVVGPTGAGKSTLAELVMGLIGPDDGIVGVQPGSRCVVFQEAFLLAGTVRENVELGASFADEQIWRALHLAAADDFVGRLPLGLDTVVGERGVSLSGGQRQRLALARALVRDPALLVLDDTTSALDPATEAQVLDNLRGQFDESSVFLIASRPSTIALADDVIFVADGRVHAHGTHDELMDSTPDYRELMAAFEADRSGDGDDGDRADRVPEGDPSWVTS